MSFQNYTLIVTSGPTREWIDPVRFISNPASGSTGWNIAMKGRKIFGKVVYITGPGHPSFKSVDGAENIPVDSTVDMAKAVQKHVGPNTLLFMTAAPADYKPAHPSEHKIKKENISALEIHLEPTIDILMSISALKFENFYKVGFAAETDNIIENAVSKMIRKNLDFVCANSVNKDLIGFGDHSNTLTVINRNKDIKQIGPSEKDVLADDLLGYIVKELNKTV